ncbi:MAG: DUF3127 domain-containing protein [Verrucomicrobiales bacterium]
MSYELQGTIKEIFETKEFNKGFTKREFVVTINEGDRFPQHIKMQLVKERCAILDQYKIGDRVKVSFELRGSEYKERYFTEIQAWRIDPAEGEAPQISSQGGSADRAGESRGNFNRGSGGGGGNQGPSGGGNQGPSGGFNQGGGYGGGPPRGDRDKDKGPRKDRERGFRDGGGSGGKKRHSFNDFEEDDF